MREQLNSNPLVQLGIVGVLLVVVAVFLMSSGGSEEEESAAPSEAPTGVASAVPGESTTAGGESLTSALSAVSQSAASAAPPPAPVLRAWQANQTIALLFVRDGGIDDRLVKEAIDSLARFPDTAVFTVPAAKISRYAGITEGVGVDRVPALVVIAPKHLKKTVPTASVSYGFQSPESVAQAVIDAGYKGKALDYHP